MKVDLKDQNFEDIRIKNTQLIGGIFVRYDFSGSQFDNVDISGINLNGAKLFNCKWGNLKILEMNQFNGHSQLVNSVSVSYDDTTIASGSRDNSIYLWDFKTGKQKAIFKGQIAYFSPKDNILAVGNETLIFIYVASGRLMTKLDRHNTQIKQVQFSPDGTKLASCSEDYFICLWNVRKTNRFIDVLLELYQLSLFFS